MVLDQLCYQSYGKNLPFFSCYMLFKYKDFFFYKDLTIVVVKRQLIKRFYFSFVD